MKPMVHARTSAKKFGGKDSDYQAIHDFIDSSKAHIADVRHRALLHSSFGCYLVEKVFGLTLTNSDGKIVSTRDIAEAHILEDLGRIPSVQDYLQHLTPQTWFGGPVNRKNAKYITLKSYTD